MQAAPTSNTMKKAKAPIPNYMYIQNGEKQWMGRYNLCDEIIQGSGMWIHEGKAFKKISDDHVRRIDVKVVILSDHSCDLGADRTLNSHYKNDYYTLNVLSKHSTDHPNALRIVDIPAKV